MSNSMSFLATSALVPSVVVIDLDVDFGRVEFAADAVVGDALRGVRADALVTKGRQVQVVGGAAAGFRQADQLGAIGPDLGVVLGQVRMEVHAPFIPLR